MAATLSAPGLRAPASAGAAGPARASLGFAAGVRGAALPAAPHAAGARGARRGPLRVLAGNTNEGGVFAPLVIVVRDVMGAKQFNQFRGKAISLHSQARGRPRDAGSPRRRRGSGGAGCARGPRHRGSPRASPAPPT
jgi:hypothetical protein